MKYEVIDNFLDENYFYELAAIFNNDEKAIKTVPWFFQRTVTNNASEANIFYMTHMLYNSNAPTSELYDTLFPLLQKLDAWCLMRIKANLYPNTHILHEHPMHDDYDFSHSAAILSLNTCDGYTKLNDGTKIDSIANRVLLFDASEKHCSTTTTNVPARINININYMQQQWSHNPIHFFKPQ